MSFVLFSFFHLALHCAALFSRSSCLLTLPPPIPGHRERVLPVPGIYMFRFLPLSSLCDFQARDTQAVVAKFCDFFHDEDVLRFQIEVHDVSVVNSLKARSDLLAKLLEAFRIH